MGLRWIERPGGRHGRAPSRKASGHFRAKHPSNAGEPKFFSMIDSFAYLSATQGLDTAPIEHAAGDSFSLRYLLTIYPAKKSKEFLERRYRQWLEE